MSTPDDSERSFSVVDAQKSGADFEPEHPTRKLGDLVGAATVKRALGDMIDRARAHEHDHQPGPWIGGTLLYGPPSCGKTFAIEVIAGELGATLWHINLDIPWHRSNLGAILDRALAHEPAHSNLVYLSALDNPHAAEALKPQLLKLDSAREHDYVAVLGAAVLPWKVDGSVARAGRLGRPLLVLPPDKPLRETFILHRLADAGMTADEADLEWIVERTDGHSFGDLEKLINDVIGHSEGKHVGRSAWRIGRRDTPPSCAEWLSTAGQHAMMNEAGGVYDDLLNYFAARQKYF